MSSSENLTTPELANRWRLSEQTLINWRRQGKGPKFFRVGRMILYSLDQIKEYEQDQTQPSSS